MYNSFFSRHIWYRPIFIGICLQQTYSNWQFHNRLDFVIKLAKIL